MSDIDTSAEAVERLVNYAEGRGNTIVAATLRALLAEIEELREVCATAVAASNRANDRATALQMHVYHLEAERDGALGLAKRHMDEKHRTQRQAAEDWDVLQQRIKAAEAERDRLREAMRQIRDQEPEREAWAVGIASAALGEDEE